MQFYAITGLINAVTSTVLGAFVLSKNARHAVNQRYAFFNLTVAVWSYGYFFWQVSEESVTALLWARVLIGGAILTPMAFLDFVVTWLSLRERHRMYLIVCYLLSFFFLALDFTPYIVSGVEARHSFHFWPVPGTAFHFMLALFLTNAFYACCLLLRAFRSSAESWKNQIRLVLIGMIIGYAGGSTNFFLWYNIPIPPIGNGLAPIYMGMMTCAILRYRAMDIEVMVRKTLVFAGLSSFAFGVFAFITFLTQELLSGFVRGSGRLAPLLISVFLIVLGFDPLRKMLVNLTDRFLFQKKYDYRKFLRDASAGFSQIKSLHELLSLVTHFVTARVRVKNAAILVHDQKGDYFKFGYSCGYPPEGTIRKGHVFKEDDPLIDFLKNERVSLDLERVREYLETGGGPKQIKGVPRRSYDFNVIRKRMEELQAACCVPSFLSDQLRNVLILGEKKSGDSYSDEDLNVLFTLAQESAIAIENARLFDQAVEKAKELEAINQELNEAQINLLRALDDTEVANKRLRDTHAQLIHEQKMATLGRLASSVGHEVNNPLTILSMNVSRAILKYRRDPDLKVVEVLDIFQKMEQNISRIKAVVNTLTGLLKKSEHGKFEPLSLKLILEETLPLVQFQTYLENLSGTEVVFDVPANLPLIKGDLERLQEVFLNLFINAYHAMAGKKDRRIIATARENAAHPGMITIEFTDNGCGMSDEAIKKVFAYGFTTKPAGKGSGMGLYMCRYIIELHGGEVKVRSKPGEGTTFIITLPVYREQTSVESGESAEF